MRRLIFAVFMTLGACTSAHLTTNVGAGGVSGLGGAGVGGLPGMGGAGAGGSGVGGGPVDAAAVDLEPEVATPDASDDVVPEISEPTVGELVVTEVMPDCAAVADDVGEWFEVQNVGSTPWDLRGCYIADTAHSEVVARHLVVQPGAYATLARFGDATGGFVPDYAYSTVKFSDQGDSVRVSCGGVTIDSVSFVLSQIVQGYSLSLDPAGGRDATAGEWCLGQSVYNTTSRGQDHGSPGTSNPACPSRD